MRAPCKGGWLASRGRGIVAMALVVSGALSAIARLRAAVVGAPRQEWRTPPLWGLRDSAPYLHDGRAATIEQAIALHGGEGQKTAERFFALSQDERLHVMTFLKSLVAPTSRSEVGG